MIKKYNYKIFYVINVFVIALLMISCNSGVNDFSALKKSVLKTDANWQLFIDDYWIENSENVTVNLHQPEKFINNPLISADVPWEENPYCFGTVIYDGQDSIFKFWYQSYNNKMEKPERTPVVYSTSKDGKIWERTNLGIIEFQGSTKNNILFQNYGFHDLYSPSVVKDILDSNPNRRYKMIWWDFPLGKKGYRDDGMCVAFSLDGIHWTKYSGNPVLHAKMSERSISDVMSVMYDKNSGKFVAYTKGWKNINTPDEFRQIVRTESDDFIHWSEPEVVITHQHNLKDPQSYGMSVAQFGNNYIGLLYMYKKPGDETIDVQLAVSHDNKKWTRVAGQQTFLPLGAPGSWDDGMIFCAPLFNHGDKTLIYYSGWDNSHNSKPRHSSIGLAELRLNGFVSLDANKNSATVTTCTVKHFNGPLIVNADAGNGTLKVELLDADNNIIPGYSAADCVPVTKDDITHEIRWKKYYELPDSIDKIKIRFLMESTKLYGFYAGADVTK